MTGVDIIGDIHGHANALERLLDALGYVLRDGVHHHPTHTVVFVGDFVDRGPRQRAVLRIARAMMDRGSARAVMGNHELNAIAWATPDGQGGFHRPHTPKNRAQHSAFLDQTEEASDAYAGAVEWFKTLPLWLDLGGLRVVHACWHAASQQVLAGWVDDEARLTKRGLHEVLNNGGAVFKAAEVLLKGPEAHLPNGCYFHDKDGHLRHETRLRWWDPDATTFRTAAIGMEGRETDLPDEPIPADFIYRDQTPVLFGHYWMQGLAQGRDVELESQPGWAYRPRGHQSPRDSARRSQERCTVPDDLTESERLHRRIADRGPRL